MERDFKGVWIPKEIWLDERLNMLEKGILVEIDSLDMGEKGCFATNAHLAQFCQCSETKVSTSVSKLVELGYISVEGFDGRQRTLKSRLSEFERQGLKISNADFQSLKQSNTYNNTGNNTERYISEFEQLWRIYPRRVGKSNALKAYIKARATTSFEQIKKGLENYNKYINANHITAKFIKHGATWFNQCGWQDEYTTKNDGAEYADLE